MTVGVIGLWVIPEAMEVDEITRTRIVKEKHVVQDLAVRYTRHSIDLVEDVALTDTPEQEWLKAVNLQ